MKFATAFLSLLSATASLAAPVAEVKSMTAAGQWTVEGMKRVCDAADTSCTWTFAINTGTAPATACSFTVTGSPASRTNSNGHVCGPYTISTGWDGQFGEGNGFTVLAVVDQAAKLIAWPSYTDKQLAGGNVVTPDQSWAVSNLAV
ncbi:hypothetical protein F5X96DRAFT_614769 [Biscogniauxia mediterranea]|nr:hypothetical protein F5X96DRAFT_614769 [Biscogniauxia mediterranea]